MIDTKKDSPEELDNHQEKLEENNRGVFSTPETLSENIVDPKEPTEKQELADDQLQNQKIRQEIENTDIDDSLKLQAQAHANDIQSLDDKKKIENLLNLARQKGVVYAVKVARHMDPYLLDVFHDRLAQEGHYKSFLK